MQPEIDLYRVRLDSATAVQSMVKCIEIKNALRAVDSERQYLVFIADNALLIDVADGGGVSIRINEIAVEARRHRSRLPRRPRLPLHPVLLPQMSTTFFNRAVSFVPCFKCAQTRRRPSAHAPPLPSPFPRAGFRPGSRRTPSAKQRPQRPRSQRR